VLREEIPDRMAELIRQLDQLQLEEAGPRDQDTNKPCIIIGDAGRRRGNAAAAVGVGLAREAYGRPHAAPPYPVTTGKRPGLDSVLPHHGLATAKTSSQPESKPCARDARQEAVGRRGSATARPRFLPPPASRPDQAGVGDRHV
jgi:hypothetical protein